MAGASGVPHCVPSMPRRYDHPGEAIYAPLLLKQLSDRKPADSVVTTDVGQHQMWSAQHMTYTRPENFITSSGLGTMGFGLPAAVGAQWRALTIR